MKIKKYEIDGKKLLIGAAKFAVGAVVSYGAGYVITKYGRNVIPGNEKQIKKLAALAGTSVLAAMVGDATSEYAKNKIDEVVNAGEEAVKMIQGISSIEEEDKVDGSSSGN